MTAHCCFMTLAPPVKVDGGAVVLVASADSVVVAAAEAEAGALEVITAASELVAAGGAAVGRVMVTPPERQKDWAYSRVAMKETSG